MTLVPSGKALGGALAGAVGAPIVRQHAVAVRQTEQRLGLKALATQGLCRFEYFVGQLPTGLHLAAIQGRMRAFEQGFQACFGQFMVIGVHAAILLEE